MTERPTSRQADRVSEALAGVRLPLENLEFALESYLRDNANWLDPGTRDLLVAVRDGVGRVALVTRALGRGEAPAADGRAA